MFEKIAEKYNGVDLTKRPDEVRAYQITIATEGVSGSSASVAVATAALKDIIGDASIVDAGEYDDEAVWIDFMTHMKLSQGLTDDIPEVEDVQGVSIELMSEMEE